MSKRPNDDAIDRLRPASGPQPTPKPKVSPETQAEINKFVHGPQKPPPPDPLAAPGMITVNQAPGMIVDHAARGSFAGTGGDVDEPVEAEPHNKHRSMPRYWDGRTGEALPDPGPRPSFARPRVPCVGHFAGLDLTAAADRAGFPGDTESRHYLSKAKQFYLFTQAGTHLANASTAPNIDVAKSSLRYVDLCREAILTMLDAIDFGVYEIKTRLGIEDEVQS